MSANVVERIKRHRDGLRAAGLRPAQIWIPDIRRPGFAEECRRQSLSLRDDPLSRSRKVVRLFYFGKKEIAVMRRIDA